MPETDEARLKRIMAQLPDHCTKCGHKFEKGEGGYPFPEKQYLCKNCFRPALERGVKNLNRVLAGEKV